MQYTRTSKILFILIIVLLVYLLSLTHKESLSQLSTPYSQFASNLSFISALQQYQKTWPPFYPGALWLFSKAAIAPAYFNLLCFYGSLFIIGVMCRNLMPNIHWFYVVLFIALINANYVITCQAIAESLFVFLALAIICIVMVVGRPWTWLKTGLLAVIVSISCLTRYFAIFWELPLCLAFVYFSDDKSAFRKRLINAVIFCSIVILLISPWLLATRYSTGWFSGMDRFASRPLYSAAGRLSIMHLAGINAKFLAKTVFIDFFSPYRYADHANVRSPLLSSEITIGILALFLLFIIALILALSLYRLSRQTSVSEAARILVSRRVIPGLFTATYVLWLMILWSVGNNDPIFIRFTYPAYPLAVLSIFVSYSWIKSLSSSILSRLPFYFLYFLVGGINIGKAYICWTKML